MKNERPETRTTTRMPVAPRRGSPGVTFLEPGYFHAFTNDAWHF